MNGTMGGFYKISEWIMRFSVVNLLWILFNLPVVFILLNMMFARQMGDIVLLSLPLLVLLPFIFFPATAAMFASVRDWLLKKEGYSLLKSYWRYYRENYKKSLLGGILLTILWSVWVADFYYLKNISAVLMFAFLILALVLYVFTINFFSVLVHYNVKLRVILKNTLLITIGSPILFFAVFIGSGIIFYISVNGPSFLVIFFSGSLLAFLSFSAFYRFYMKLAVNNEQE